MTEDFFSDCLLLADDFQQYYLGAGADDLLQSRRYHRNRPAARGKSAEFGGPALADNPLDEAGAFSLTSDALPPDQFPLFAGNASSTYVTADGVNPFGPLEGERYAGAVHADGSYMRLRGPSTSPRLPPPTLRRSSSPSRSAPSSATTT